MSSSKVTKERTGYLNQNSLDKIIRSLPVGIAVIRASDRTVVKVNPAAAKMVAKSQEELVGSPCCENFCASDGPCPVLDLHKKVSGVDRSILTKSGELYHVIKSVVEIDLDGELHLVESFQDMSELIKANEEKEELQKKLIQAQKMEAVGTLAGGIAHEFRNILQAIQSYSEVLKMSGAIPPERISNIDGILKMSDRGADLTSQLLTFSRKFVSSFHSFRLNRLIPECVEVLDRIIPKTVTIKTAVNAKKAFIFGDPNQIAQVFTNLALNSVDAMKDRGTLTIKTSYINRDDAPLKFRAKMENKRYVEIVISDTGKGMDDETLDKVFDPFFTTKEVGKGTGLGLSVVYGIIEAHNGYISCQSTIGEGTTFSIYLPEADQRPDTENLSIESDEHKLPTGYEGILIVDDEISILEVISDFLVYQGFQVLKAHSGEEAIEVYKREKGKIDIAVIDLGMPGMGGADCIKKLREINPELKIVVASGYAASDQISYCKDLGAEAFVAKPFKIETLLKTVRKLLDE